MPFFHPAGSHLFADSNRGIGLHCLLLAGSCVCAHTKAWRPNKAEIDAVLGRESFLMVADIQLQKILHWMWKRSKAKARNWEKKRKRVSTREFKNQTGLIVLFIQSACS